MFMKRIFLLSGLSLFSLSIQASEVDFALGKETASIELLLDRNAINAANGQVTVGGLYNENDDLLGYVGVTSTGSITTDRPYTLGVGIRGYYASVDTPDVSVGAIAIGGEGRVKFTLGVPLSFAAEIHYAPKITTFSDGDELVDTRVRLETMISNNATAYVGYRRIKLNLKSKPHHSLDDHVQVGVRFSF